MNTLRAVVTVALIGAFTAFIAFLLDNVGASQTSWEHYVYLLSGVEAVVFAAVGWLFGKDVHRERAEKAEVAAAEAQRRQVDAAREAAAEREKGLGLARAIVSHESFATRAAQIPGAQRGTAPPASQMSALGELARAAYPEATPG